MGKAKTSDRTRDVRCVAKLLRGGGYSYDQSKHLIAEARCPSSEDHCTLDGVLSHKHGAVIGDS